VPALSVAENLVLGGRHPRRWLGIDWKRTWHDAAELLQALGDDIDPRTRVAALPPDECQIVEIVRAMSFDSSTLVLDEPTTFLDAAQVARLFEMLDVLRTGGKAILIISHRLDEMMRVGDRYSVMRDGRVVASAPAAEVDDAWLVHRLIGDDARSAQVTRHEPPRQQASTDAVVSAWNLSDVAGRVRSVSFDLRPGEIVGLGGPVGSGQSELLETIFGARPQSVGNVMVDGASRGRTPLQAMRVGIGYVPDDRRGKALVTQSSVMQNMLMGARAMQGRSSVKNERFEVERWIERLRIKTPGPDARFDRLSGGNQQKVVMARWLMLSPRLLLLHEPTRGVDMAGKQEIYRLIRDLAAEGAAVLFASSEIEELHQLADRLLVMRTGSIVMDIPRADLTLDAITAFANGLWPHEATTGV